jgi:hypothetical protein
MRAAAARVLAERNEQSMSNQRGMMAITFSRSFPRVLHDAVVAWIITRLDQVVDGQHRV